MKMLKMLVSMWGFKIFRFSTNVASLRLAYMKYAIATKAWGKDVVRSSGRWIHRLCKI